MRTQRWSPVALVATVMLVLVSCGDDDTGGPATADDTTTQDDTDAGTEQDGDASVNADVTLTFWNGFTGPDRPAVEELVGRFNESRDDVHIDMEIMPWDVFYDRLLPAYGSGTGPDIVAMDTVQIPQYAERGLLREMGDYYDDQDSEADALVETAVEASTFRGTAYGVPMNFTTTLLYWNKGMFEEAGLDPESPPQNWDEFADYARQLTIDEDGDGSPEQFGLAMADHATVPMWQILLWQGGGGVASQDGTTALLDAPETIEAMEFWSDLVINEKIAPVGLGGADADALFQAERAAMEIVGPWMTTGFAEAGIDFGLAMPPEGPGGSVTLGSSTGFALNADLDEAAVAAATDFFRFWNSVESQIYWAVNTGFPPSRTDIPAEDLADNPYVAAFSEHADRSRLYLHNVQEFAKVNGDIFEPALQRILNEQGTVEEIFGEADAEIQAVLDAE